MRANTIYSNSQELQLRSLKLRRLRSLIILLLIPTIIISGILLSSETASSITNSPPSAVAESKKSTPKITPVDAGGQPSGTTPVKKVAAIIKPIPNCVPATNATRPTIPVLSSSTTGLIQTPIVESRYVVYGDTTSQISNQIFRCSPVVSGGVRYAASAEYAINWSFQFQGTENGLCTISSASVGLGLSKTLPQWQPINTPSTQLQKQWNTFITNLDAHENEHIKLNRIYAAKILTDLQNFPETQCESIDSSANARANALITELNNANNWYDSDTNHGLTEGANL